MKVITALQDLGYRITIDGENIRLKPLSEISPDRTVAQPLIEELKARKQEAIAYLSVETVVCSWLERSVPSNECIKPCYRFDPGEVRECKHLVAWWGQRAKWLQDNGLWL